MKFKYLIIICSMILIQIIACDETYLEKNPTGVVFEGNLNNMKGLNSLLLGTYNSLDGLGGGDKWSGGPFEWVAGGVRSDDAYKGSIYGVETELNPIEEYHILSTNSYVAAKWRATYDGVSRANDVLRILKKSKENVETEFAIQVESEAKFLRAWFYFILQRTFYKVPYINEETEEPSKVKNDVLIWDKIESDLEFAANNLPSSQEVLGKPTKWAAMAVKARVHLFQDEFDDAKVLLDNIINSGQFALMDNFEDNFDVEKEHNQESIFEVEYSAQDPTQDNTPNSFELNFPFTSDMNSCCGLYQPTQNLVNAYKVDENTGLPLLNSFNEENLKNDKGILSNDEFIPTEDPVDPRLDWTIGRRGIPYLDHGIMRGSEWVWNSDEYGPYVLKKYAIKKSQLAQFAHNGRLDRSANNFRAYRYSHVLLWRAEVAVEENDLEYARQLINQIRERAGNSLVMGKCTTYKLPKGVAPEIDYTQPAANYKVGLYSNFPDQNFARKAVQMEIRLEFALEGHRFFDLVRWGIAEDVLNEYIQKDGQYRVSPLENSTFNSNQDNYYPIPQNQIDIQGNDILVQDSGYM